MDEKNPRLNCMVVFKDQCHPLRLWSSVKNRKDTADFRHPVILDPHHPLLKRLIEYCHITLHHASINTLICSLRKPVWVLRCRRNFSHHIPSYLKNVCEMRQYPIPLFLKEDEKIRVYLFTCAVYQVVHLKLIYSLSTKTFLDTFRRFIARIYRLFG